MDSLRNALDSLRGWLAWLPDPIAAVFLILIAVAVALAVHGLLRRLVRRLIATRYPAVHAVVTRMRDLSRLAFVILALFVALPMAPLDRDFKYLIAKLLLMAIIALIGWAAITALHISADIYLRRYRLDVEDNLLARKHNTQIRVLLRSVDVLIVLFTLGAALMTFQTVRQYGVSLFASAGAAGIILGLAARPVLSNLLAGIQIALTQPIRVEDSVVIEGEWGWIETITSTYVVIRIWDLRRLIVPLTYFIEKPFQNWTYEGAALLGTVMLHVDYTAPLPLLRDKLKEIVEGSNLWDGRTAVLQVTDASETTMQLRALISARNAGDTFSLRCLVREGLIAFLQSEHPGALPRSRTEVAGPAATPPERERIAAAAAGVS